MDEDAKLEWTRQLRDDLDGDGKIDFDEYLPPEIIKENDDHVRIDNTHDKSSLILLNARRNDAGKYMLKERFSVFCTRIPYFTGKNSVMITLESGLFEWSLRK